MQSGAVSQKNVERIAARIVANELEFRPLFDRELKILNAYLKKWDL